LKFYQEIIECQRTADAWVRSNTLRYHQSRD
jgi:hypothetical protein